MPKVAATLAKHQDRTHAHMHGDFRYRGQCHAAISDHINPNHPILSTSNPNKLHDFVHAPSPSGPFPPSAMSGSPVPCWLCVRALAVESFRDHTTVCTPKARASAFMPDIGVRTNGTPAVSTTTACATPSQHSAAN